MKKQPQQPEQQRSDYSASAPNSRPDRASGERDLLPCPFCGAREVDYQDECGGIYCHECSACGPGVDEISKATRLWNTRATPLSVGQDASSEPRQNEQNAAVAVREALAELVRYHDALNALYEEHPAYQDDNWQINVDRDEKALAAAWSAARALLNGEPK